MVVPCKTTLSERTPFEKWKHSYTAIYTMIETILFTAMTALWWISTLTVLLPFAILLKINKAVSNLWFSFLYSCFAMPMFKSDIAPIRQQIFRTLEEHLKGRDVRVPLEVLEIGAGPGLNLEFYPENCYLTALDMNPEFERYFRKNRERYPQVKFRRLVTGMAEDMKEIRDESADVVVGTYVLCSVQDVQQVLREILRVLKPGGKYVFMEHGAFPKSDLRLWVQRFAAPLWRLYCDGCHLERSAVTSIRKAGFTESTFTDILPSSMLFYLRPHLLGIAAK